MQNICPKEDCTGCSACLNICSKDAIKMKADACGFMYPEIDQDKCIDCGLCQKVCPSINPHQKVYPKQCYALTMKTEKELLSCASGGAATAISNYVLRNGGVVYGCTGKDIRNVKHIRIHNIDELHLLKGSKYVQSKIGYIFRTVKQDLKKNLTVLFIGTPCQIAGLKSFLCKDYNNLFTVDLVCHGVPSQQLLNDNIDLYLGKENSENDITVDFRQKLINERRKKFFSIFNSRSRIEYGWFLYKNHPNSKEKITRKYYKDYYMFGFLRGLFFRNNCYSCPYACAERISDFTISDFWGLGKDAGFENGKGVSAVLVNSEKGEILFKEVSLDAVCVARNVTEAVRGNGQLQYPSKRHRNYYRFQKSYPLIGFEKAAKKCLVMENWIDAFQRKKNEIKTIIRKIIVSIVWLLLFFLFPLSFVLN